MKTKKGDKYLGLFKDGNRSGLGVMTYMVNGSVTCEYSGEWRLNNKHGWGKMKWEDGSWYEGRWNVD